MIPSGDSGWKECLSLLEGRDSRPWVAGREPSIGGSGGFFYPPTSVRLFRGSARIAIDLAASPFPYALSHNAGAGSKAA
jgi:hypothetical protein